MHNVLFDHSDGECIKRAALRTEGAADISGIDAAGWRRLCCSFGPASGDLCNSLPRVARRLCTEKLDPTVVETYVASRLVGFDKCPGVRPIGISETVRRIVGKAIMTVLNPYVAASTGPVQLCAGLQASCEAGVHALRALFANSDTEAVLLVDASNAFNSLNRRVTLLNTPVVCPPLTTLLLNTYRLPGRLVTASGETLLSREGTTQGDPVAMAMYAVGIVPLIHRLADTGSQQVCG